MYSLLLCTSFISCHDGKKDLYDFDRLSGTKWLLKKHRNKIDLLHWKTIPLPRGRYLSFSDSLMHFYDNGDSLCVRSFHFSYNEKGTSLYYVNSDGKGYIAFDYRLVADTLNFYWQNDTFPVWTWTRQEFDTLLFNFCQ